MNPASSTTPFDGRGDYFTQEADLFCKMQEAYTSLLPYAQVPPVSKAVCVLQTIVGRLQNSLMSGSDAREVFSKTFKVLEQEDSELFERIKTPTIAFFVSKKRKEMDSEDPTESKRKRTTEGNFLIQPDLFISLKNLFQDFLEKSPQFLRPYLAVHPSEQAFFNLMDVCCQPIPPFERVMLPREMSLQTIEAIKRRVLSFCQYHAMQKAVDGQYAMIEFLKNIGERTDNLEQIPKGLSTQEHYMILLRLLEQSGHLALYDTTLEMFVIPSVEQLQKDTDEKLIAILTAYKQPVSQSSDRQQRIAENVQMWILYHL